MGEAVNLLNALAGLIECFDEHGEFHAKAEMVERCWDARAAIKQALPENFREVTSNELPPRV
jgi:hypothetical protein